MLFASLCDLFLGVAKRPSFGSEKLEEGPESIFHATQPESVHFFPNFTVYSAHASVHFTAYFPCDLYTSLCTCPIRMPLRGSLSTFPACLCAFHCLLSLRMPLCISLSTFPAYASTHFTLYLPYACLFAFHCLLSLRSRANLRGSRANLSGGCACQIALAVVPCEPSHIFAVCARPSAGIKVVTLNVQR